MSLIVNLLAGPGAFKTATSAGIFSLLKLHCVSCELIPEVAKDLTWEERFSTLENQFYVFGKQFNKLKQVNNKVDVIIMDSPLLLSILYNKASDFEALNKSILTQFNTFNNINFFLHRNPVIKYESEGRNQKYSEAIDLDNKLKEILSESNIDYMDLVSGYSTINKITEIILDRFNKKRKFSIIETSLSE